MVLLVAHPGHGSPCGAHAVIFSSPCLLSGHVACESHDNTSNFSRSNNRAIGNVKVWFARIKMRARAPRGIRATLRMRNFGACARGGWTGRRFLPTSTARAHHTVNSDLGG